MAIVYLDADDEITSAASRIRIADEKRIALVVPYGSRLATSRINFRLLAREAQVRGHRLSVVAGDAATRALAASAGLPVFGSVGEYEEAETTRPGQEPEGVVAAAVATEPPVRRRRPPSGTANPDAANAAGVASGAAATSTPRPTPDPGPARPRLDAEETQVVALPAVAPAPAPSGSAGAGLATRAGTTGAAGVTSTAGARTLRWRGRPVAWPYGQNAAIAVAALVALGVLALAVGLYVLLPSASARVAVRLERIGPVPMEIRADPEATAPNAAAGVIPAQRLTFDIAVSGQFPATGRRVEASRARGEVRLQSKNPVDDNNVRAGSIVSTAGGIQFRTTERVIIPKATITGLIVSPGEVTVAVEAVEPGPDGNVDAEAISVPPSTEDAALTVVSNPEPTSGGSRREFPLVEQEDVDAAITQLGTQLDAQFSAMLADPARVPPGLTVFADTRALADPLPTTAPETLVGQEVEEFPLGLATTGTVIAVDPRPVESVAADRIAGTVASGYRLVDGSIQVTPGEPAVSGETVSFPVSATGSQIRVVDADTLRDEIKGKPLDEARSILADYGQAELTVWPDWVTAVPTIDGRVDVRVELPAGVEPPSGSPAPSGGSASPDGASAAPSPPDGSGPPAASGSPGAPAASSEAPPSSVEPGLGVESPRP
jgi:hypothetical protein